MKSVRLLAAAVLATTGLVAVGATTEAANASSKELLVDHSSVMKYEKFAAWGEMSTPVVRTVKLQYRTHTDDPWTTKMTVTSYPNGKFEFYPVSTSKTRYWRYYAPASGGHASIKGYSKKISVVSQKVQSITIYNSVQCSISPQPITVLVDFYPARRGRDVRLSTSDGNFYGYEDYSGVAKIEFTPPSNNLEGTFNARADAAGYNGSSVFSSVTLHYTRLLDLCN